MNPVPTTHHREQLVNAYFKAPERTITLSAGEVLLSVGSAGDRLYYVLEGKLVESATSTVEGAALKCFGVGDLVGFRPFFTSGVTADRDVKAAGDVRVAYIDKTTPPVLINDTSSFADQFMPLIISQLSVMAEDPNLSTYHLAGAQTQRHMDRLSVLGQLTTGIAHELNNSLTVLSTGTEWLIESCEQMLADQGPLPSLFFNAGLSGDRQLSRREEKARTIAISEEFELSTPDARALARTGISTHVIKAIPPSELARNLMHYTQWWDFGATLYDMRLAASQSEHVVLSVKSLGARQEKRLIPTDVNETLNAAISLTRNSHKLFNLQLELGDLPEIIATPGELIQVWVNLIRNACEAHKSSQTSEPTITITTQRVDEAITICVSDNGPGIADDLKPHIFDPHVTSREDSAGLGLGLTIVRRFVSEHGGAITVESTQEGTVFTVTLPLEEA